MSSLIQTPPRSSPQRRPANRQSGFTLIEVLVVIGIILILIGISVAAFGTLQRHARAQHTKAVLEAAKAMLSEYEASAGKQSVAMFKANYDTPSAPIDVSLGVSSAVVTFTTTTVPWQQYSDNVLAELLKLPNNRTVFDKLPTQQVRKDSTTGLYELLDGYGNPILFVPSIGVTKITVGGGATTGFMQNDGRVNTIGSSITAPNPRYFFMSRGIDGNPGTGDDNHYSFEQ